MKTRYRYSAGYKRCSKCAVWIPNAQDMLRCPDCNLLLSYKANHAGKQFEGVRY